MGEGGGGGGGLNSMDHHGVPFSRTKNHYMTQQPSDEMFLFVTQSMFSKTEMVLMNLIFCLVQNLQTASYQWSVISV